MYIYIIAFIIAFILLYISEKMAKKGKKVLIFEILSIGLLAFVAAIRDETIGTDVLIYVKPVFQLCNQLGFGRINDIWYNVEIGYKIFNCIIALFTSKISIYLFFQQVFILGFAYLGIKGIYKKNYSFVYLIYLLIFYNRSLNIVRQAMAISLCIYSLKFLLENKNFKFILIVLLAFLFHKTALVFLLAIIIYKLYKKNAKYVYYMAIFIIIVGLIFIFLFPECIKLMTSIGIMSTDYLYYLDNYVDDIGTISSFELLLDITYIVEYIIFNKLRKKENSSFYFILALIDVICLIISTKYTAANRFGMYFRIPVVLFLLSNMDVIFVNKYSKVNVGNIIAVVISVIFWYYVFVYGKSGGTVPFTINQDSYFYQIFLK